MKTESFLVLGKDKKMSACCSRLRDSGFEAAMLEDDDFNELYKFKNIILPLPTIANSKISGTGKGLDELIAKLSDGQKVFCGNIAPELYKNFYSYYNNEAFLVRNSRLTAQGVLNLIINNVENDFKAVSVAVLGYGRCGKSVCRLLKNCGMLVTSFSRREETRALAEDEGLLVADIADIEQRIADFDIIINTIPSNIISQEAIGSLKQKNIYIEIASKPYGFNISETDVFNFRYILGESLPGRFVPVSAGYNIADTVLSILKEEEYG